MNWSATMRGGGSPSSPPSARYSQGRSSHGQAPRPWARRPRPGRPARSQPLVIPPPPDHRAGADKGAPDIATALVGVPAVGRLAVGGGQSVEPIGKTLRPDHEDAVGIEGQGGGCTARLGGVRTRLRRAHPIPITTPGYLTHGSACADATSGVADCRPPLRIRPHAAFAPNSHPQYRPIRRRRGMLMFIRYPLAAAFGHSASKMIDKKSRSSSPPERLPHALRAGDRRPQSPTRPCSTSRSSCSYQRVEEYRKKAAGLGGLLILSQEKRRHVRPAPRGTALGRSPSTPRTVELARSGPTA